MKETLLENNEVKIELEKGILIATWRNPNVDLNEAKQAVKYRLECTNYNTYPLLSNIKSIKNISKEARDFLASEEGCEGIAVAAILINSSIGSMIGNFWIRINKPLRQTKLFTNEKEALKWLANYIEP